MLTRTFELRLHLTHPSLQYENCANHSKLCIFHRIFLGFKPFDCTIISLQETFLKVMYSVSEATAKWVFMASPSHSAVISILQDYTDRFSGSPLLPCLGGHFFALFLFIKIYF